MVNIEEGLSSLRASSVSEGVDLETHPAMENMEVDFPEINILDDKSLYTSEGYNIRGKRR